MRKAKIDIVENTAMQRKLQYLTTTEVAAVESFTYSIKKAFGELLLKLEVFGSKAKGNYTEASDIDILVVVRERSLEAMDMLAEITAGVNLGYNVSISPVVFSKWEYETNLKMSAPFPLAVEAEGVLL